HDRSLCQAPILETYIASLTRLRAYNGRVEKRGFRESIVETIRRTGLGRYFPAPLRQLKRFLLGEPSLDPVVAVWETPHQWFYWTQHPSIAASVNQQISGVPWMAATQYLKVRWAYEPLGRGLSLGCGTGPLERDLWRQRICEEIDAVDLSWRAVRSAKTEARRSGMSGIHYRCRDFNRMPFPRERYDFAAFHGSLHHAADPEGLLRRVRETLRPGGLLYLDEYVGPSRDEWSEEHLRPAREIYDSLPEELKRTPMQPPVAWDDPSEMAASSRILPAVRERFEIVDDRPYWGNLLFPLVTALHGGRLLEDEFLPLVREWIEREQELIRDGTFRSPLYAVVIARR
ncbi:MAG TPA: class I SAM-dependent methyltransferase, partial [Thermoanaerobaculia bacterium]|nr:class I SAM-dependent methyltransferase [Thermoanaerobaculia bacterium]